MESANRIAVPPLAGINSKVMCRCRGAVDLPRNKWMWSARKSNRRFCDLSRMSPTTRAEEEGQPGLSFQLTRSCILFLLWYMYLGTTSIYAVEYRRILTSKIELEIHVDLSAACFGYIFCGGQPEPANRRNVRRVELLYILVFPLDRPSLRPLPSNLPNRYKKIVPAH